MGYDDGMAVLPRLPRRRLPRPLRPASRGDRRDDYDEEVIEISTNRLYRSSTFRRVSWQDLKDHFRQAGDVIHTKILTEGPGSRSRDAASSRWTPSTPPASAIQMLSDTDLQTQHPHPRGPRR